MNFKSFKQSFLQLLLTFNFIKETSCSVDEIKQISNQIESNPSSLLFYKRSLVYYKQFNIQQAKQDLNSCHSEKYCQDMLTRVLVEEGNESERESVIKSCDKQSLDDYLIIHPLDYKVLEFRYDSITNFRSECFQDIKDFSKLLDMKKTGKNYYSLGKSLFEKGDLDKSYQVLVACRKFDQDDKGCKTLVREVKSVVKGLKEAEKFLSSFNFKKVLEQVKELKSIPPSLHPKLYRLECQAYHKLKKYKLGLDSCEKYLATEGDDVDILVVKGEVLMGMEKFEDAMNVFRRVDELGDERGRKGYQKSQTLLKRQGRPDYYKTLGVPNDASPRDIKKAYRKMAKLYHPDKYKGDLTPDEVDDKMSKINLAHEILSNPELRERYDAGDDPNDQNSGQGQNPFGFGNGFQGFRFQGGHQHFQFNF